ncbi:ATP-binding cassette domain-containing protein [Pseudoalteromonas sp. AOP31-A2-14]|uniref:ATP-binding cassette domain-containing protein n=1 Tax=unclassified Pseudoalteromonas TaxID=194690 RepID=UPI003F9CF8EA
MMVQIIELWRKSTDKNSANQHTYKTQTLNISSFSKTYRLLVQIAVTCVGVSYVLEQELSVGGMIAANLIIGRALAPYEQSVMQLQHWVTCFNAWKRLTKEGALVDIQLETEPPIPKGSLIAEKIIYKYPNANKVFIKPFSAQFNYSHAIVGSNGSGKSTLLKIMSGENTPFSGEVRIAASQLSNWSFNTKQKIIGIYRSDLPIYKSTIINNMSTDPNLHNSIIQLSQQLGLHERIMQQAQGYDTEILDVKNQLSSSEIQLILLIRALCNNPHIFIADNIDDHLDSKAELALIKILEKRDTLEQITIYSAKKMNLLSKAKNILYLEAGNVKFHGRTADFFASRNKIKEVSNG